MTLIGLGYLALLLHAPIVAASPASTQTHVLGQIEIPSLPRPFAQAEKRVVAAYQRLGISIRMEVYPAKRVLSLLDNGALDGNTMRLDYDEADHPNLRKVPTPLVCDATVAYSLVPRPEFHGAQNLAHFRTVAVRGMVVTTSLAPDKPSAIADTPLVALSLLKAGRADILLGPLSFKPQISSWLGQPIVALEPALSTQCYYHFVHKRHANLVARLDQAIRALGGTIQTGHMERH